MQCLGIILDRKLNVDPPTSTMSLQKSLTIKPSIAHSLFMTRLSHCIKVFSGCPRRITRFVYGVKLKETRKLSISHLLHRSPFLIIYLKFRLLIGFYKVNCSSLDRMNTTFLQLIGRTIFYCSCS